MKPFQILFFMIAIGLALLALTFLSIEDAIVKDNKTEDGWKLGQIELKYPTFQHFLTDTTVQKAEIDSIVNNIALVIDDSDLEDTTVITEIPDQPYVKKRPQKMNFESIDTALLEKISYPNTSYLKTLVKNLKDKEFRIIHYGDSQLEGDRISGYLRSKFQSKYGGSGPGFLPLLPVYHQIAAVVEPSENWIRNAIFDPSQKKRTPATYGAYLSLSRFTSVLPDSVSKDTLDWTSAEVNVGVSNRAYRSSKYFNTLKLHYDNASSPCYLEVKKGNTILFADTLKKDGRYHLLKINLPSWDDATPITLNFKAKYSPDFYGLSLENNYGVQLDNVAMRGSAGTKFVSLDYASTQEMMHQLKPQLILMQFGGNVMPYLKDSSSIARYMRQLKAQINRLKKWNPKSQIMFIGPSDMSYAVDGQMQSYPLLPALNNAIKELCLSRDIAYWSMFDAMGGTNSMLTWVEKNYAANDYTHFAPKGTKIISELFYLALMLEIEKIE